MASLTTDKDQYYAGDVVSWTAQGLTVGTFYTAGFIPQGKEPNSLISTGSFTATSSTQSGSASTTVPGYGTLSGNYYFAITAWIYDPIHFVYKLTVIAQKLISLHSSAPPTQYTITVNTSPSGLDSPQGAGTFNQGTQITVSVASVSGYTFQKWQRDGVDYSTQQSFSYTVEAAHTFTAVFTTGGGGGGGGAAFNPWPLIIVGAGITLAIAVIWLKA